ncbi:TniB family NTP-binding protein (plasmid) [Mesorhizobium sp. AR07]|uniref:TniB family NTP-binding protein n=1 Tax=Mesorhizobium sp. AR07 TaxID=2865838 RepID=UPI002160B365|nr:TniB family NTP-binding protein [Mesorhizobium sp. AR07]UVK49152.1 TniB family NTP-binding protein [Mesorhizobium sp. AR07]
MRKMLVPHQRFKKGLQAALTEHMAFSPSPSAEGTALMFTGRSGSGKSKTLRYYAKQYPAVRDEPGMHRRVLYVHVPPGADKYALQRRIMAALGIPVDKRRTSDELSLDIAWHLKEQRVELMILDEFNHMVDNRSNRTQFLAADVLKELANWNCCQMVFGGLASSLLVLESNHQLLRRTFSRFEMKGYDWNVDAEQTEFVHFLGTLADEIDYFHRRPALDDMDLAERTCRATGGLAGLSSILTFKALEVALTMESTALLPRHFEAAFDVMKPIGTKGNPFVGKISSVSFPEDYDGKRFLEDDERSGLRESTSKPKKAKEAA